MSIRRVAIALSILPFVSVVFAAEAPTVAREDRARLLTAGLRPDPVHLLQFLRPTTTTDRARIPGLLAQLEDDDFEKRRVAGLELVRLGRAAREALAALPAGASVDLRRQAHQLIEDIDNQLTSTTTLAILRTLCRQNHPEAVPLVLEHLPYLGTAPATDLLTSFLRLDPTPSVADQALRSALADSVAERRAAAGLLLASRGSREQCDHAIALLKDADPVVRLRTAQGLLQRGDVRGLAALVELLDGPMDRAWQAEELLRWVAGTTAPVELLGNGAAQHRRACRTAWDHWLAMPDRVIDWASLRRAPRRPGLFLTCRGDRIELFGSDGQVRYSYETPGGGSFVDAHVLPDGHFLTFDDNDAELRRMDAQGKTIWKWKAPGGEIAVSLQPLLHENRILVVTDEQLHEVTLAGKHLRALRLGEKFFSDACLVDSHRILALTDEGFFLVDRENGGILREIRVPNKNDLFDSGKMVALPEGLVAIHSTLLDQVILVDASGRILEDGPPTKNRQIWGIGRYRTGNWVLGGGGQPRLGETTPDERVVREVFLTNRPTRFRLALEDLRLGLDDDSPAPFSVDSPEYRIASLGSPDVTTRRRAATALGQFRTQAMQVIPALILALEQDDEATQINAARSLSQLGAPALPALRQAVKSGKLPARVQAARGIGMLGAVAAPAVPDLIALIEDKAIAASLRSACCDSLTQLGGIANEAAPTLRGALTDNDPGVRRSAAVALGVIGRGEAENITALIAALDDRDVTVSVPVANALARWGPRSTPAVPTLVRLLKRPQAGSAKKDAPLALRQEVVNTLGDIGPTTGADGVTALLEVLRTPSEDANLRQGVIRTLGRMGEAGRPAVPALREILLAADRTGQLHGDTLKSLAQLRQFGGMEVLLEAARAGNESVRLSTITTLGGMGVDGQVALPLLRELNTTEKSARVRTAIQRALRRIPTPPVS